MYLTREYHNGKTLGAVLHGVIMDVRSIEKSKRINNPECTINEILYRIIGDHTEEEAENIIKILKTENYIQNEVFRNPETRGYTTFIPQWQLCIAFAAIFISIFTFFFSTCSRSSKKGMDNLEKRIELLESNYQTNK